MTPRLYTPADYPQLATWWQGHGWQPIPQDFLPRYGIIIATHAAAFLYNDPTSKIAAMEFTVTNPTNTPMQSMRAINALVIHMRGLAAELGKTALFTACQQPSLSRLFTACGFTPTESTMIHHILKWD
jgi:N-acetylglutamate synthase-like GNAT family acetyltransferase